MEHDLGAMLLKDGAQPVRMPNVRDDGNNLGFRTACPGVSGIADPPRPVENRTAGIDLDGEGDQNKEMREKQLKPGSTTS